VRVRERRGVEAILLAMLASLLAAVAVEPIGENSAGSPILVPVGVSLQEAIDAAPAGSVLRLAAGQYEGNAVVDKSLTLRGPTDGTAQIAGGSMGAVIRIVGEGTEVVLEDLAICCARGYEGHGVAIEGSATAELLRARATGNAWYGVSASDHAEVTLRDCALASNASAGLRTQDFARAHLERCVIEDNTSHGLLALHVSEVTLVGCEIRGNWAGIWGWDGTRVRLTDSLLADNADYGAIASTAALLVVEDSLIAGNGHHGLLFEESSRGVLRRSRIVGNGADGLFAEQDAILEIYECDFTLNGRVGLRLAFGECIGGFDPKRYFAGRVEGAKNVVPGPDAADGNKEAALCPAPPGTWPEGFVVAD